MKQNIVLTGASCSGKTSLANAFKRTGYVVIPETARNYLHIEDVNIRQRAMATTQQILECMNYIGCRVLDRGLPDYMVFSRYLGVKPIKRDLTPRYNKVFFLERLAAFEGEGRVEADQKQAEEIGELIRQEYIKLGYEPISVPNMSIKDRVEFCKEQMRR